MIFIELLMGHAVADCALQSDSMARGKNRNRVPLNIPSGQKRQIAWPYFLTSHALIHGASVFVITGSIWLGISETIAHWFIDFGKCENWYGIHLDQSLHIGCKLLWIFLA